MTLPITAERLALRRFTYDDVPDLLECVSDPSFARATPEIEATAVGVRAYIDMQNAYQLFERDKRFELAIERKADGKLIGLLGLVCRAHGQGEVGYALGLAYRGQGYATEAAAALMTYGFTVLGLHRIEAGTTSGNRGSWRVMERLGMRREGQFREATFREGKWTDVLIYGILADEWSFGTGASPET